MKSLVPILSVSSMEKSIKFYADALGFSPTMTMPGDNGELLHASLQRGAGEIMLGPLSHLPPDDREHLGKGVRLYLTVADDEDVDSTFERAKTAGAKVVQEPTDQFWGHRDWVIADPDGYVIYVTKEVRSVTPEHMREAALASSPAD